MRVMQIFFMLKDLYEICKSVFPRQAIVITFLELRKTISSTYIVAAVSRELLLKIQKISNFYLIFLKLIRILRIVVRAKKQLIQTTLLPQHCKILFPSQHFNHFSVSLSTTRSSLENAKGLNHLALNHNVIWPCQSIQRNLYSLGFSANSTEFPPRINVDCTSFAAKVENTRRLIIGLNIRVFCSRQ